MALFRRSLFGGGSLFGRSRVFDRDYDRAPVATRAGYYGFLSAPSLPLFIVSIVMAAAVVLFRYGKVDVPVVTSANAFEILAIAYAILVAGVVLRRF
ncbi:hypothetical protein IHQ68_03800 [Chelatococcus sambhunathii]|uniref:Uncharacterized protein n=1 Tax=Chelatococcus sambhunathii TaxID=363953 RepID=A0ABU1DCE4_9HYPH|nr:hypothetical protein [Chelatococcus sambhunathii]MDR4305747.1 hypothetical protein [Chelatococcus sambhunathii]